MKFAAISDIHGNLPALEAVLADIAREGVDATVNLGDIVSGPLWPAETADRLMALDLPTLAGNHERQVLTQSLDKMGASDRHAHGQLAPRHCAWLASLPATLQWRDDVLLCHGTPSSDLVYWLETVTDDYQPGRSPGVRPASPSEVLQRLGDAMQGVAHGLILCGHTHVPRCERVADGRLIVNPGSVGLQAYDDVHPHPHVMENGSPQARYALLTREPAGWQIELRCIDYDFEAAAMQAERNGRPDWADALRTGRVGRTEADAIP
jgi:predicted phosphodiesterase